MVWLHEESHQAAGERAAAIVELLPYERIGDRVSVLARETPPKRPEFERCERAANDLGVAFFFVGSPTGADDEDFEQADLP